MIAHSTHKPLLHNLVNAVLVATGFMLSPLSWWNDLLVNIPLAYLFSWPFSLINEQWFLAGFILGYWLSNLLGLLMLHWGGTGLISQRYVVFNTRQSFLISAIYSVIIICLVLLGVLPSPGELAKHF